MVYGVRAAIFLTKYRGHVVPEHTGGVGAARGLDGVVINHQSAQRRRRGEHMSNNQICPLWGPVVVKRCQSGHIYSREGPKSSTAAVIYHIPLAKLWKIRTDKVFIYHLLSSC